MKKEVLTFVSNILFGACLGVIIDVLAGTGIIFTAIGLVVGIVLAIILKNRKAS